MPVKIKQTTVIRTLMQTKRILNQNQFINRNFVLPDLKYKCTKCAICNVPNVYAENRGREIPFLIDQFTRVLVITWCRTELPTRFTTEYF